MNGKIRKSLKYTSEITKEISIESAANAKIIFNVPELMYQ
jgi:hypothetical protein